MKHDKVFVSSGVLLWLGIAAGGNAQAPKEAIAATTTSAQQSGPSMNETITFLKETYEKRPNETFRVSVTNSTYTEQEVIVDSPESCRLQITYDDLYQDQTFMHFKRRLVLALDASDPLSISVVRGATDDDTPTPYFLVTVKRTIGVNYRLPLPVHDDRPVLDRAKLKPGFLAGFVLSISPTEFTIIAQDENRWRFALPVPHPVITRDDTTATMSDVQVGDELTYEPSDTENKLKFKSLAERAVGKQYIVAGLPTLPDEETANRVAKALIHAMVLCHKDEKPSPF